MTVIEIEKISKQYKLGSWNAVDLRSSFGQLLNFKRKESQYIWALKDIDLMIEEGDVMGIIGPNGSGKSTLLKILSRITQPSSGKARIRGRTAALLEVGTGFHPELTGRENIFLNGSILGMTRNEIRSKFDEIVDFSGVEKFIDTPIKHFSSGMYVRLAFSVAAHLESEVLLVDEVLSVGDLAFKEKSFNKMNTIASEGKTILFVSHNLGALKKMCNKAVQLNLGEIVDFGVSSKVLQNYYSTYTKDNVEAIPFDPNKEINIKEIRLLDEKENECQFFQSGDNIRFMLSIDSKNEFPNINIRLELQSLENGNSFSLSNYLTGDIIEIKKGTNTIICEMPKNPLNHGTYKVDLFIKNKKTLLQQINGLKAFEVYKGEFYSSGILPQSSNSFLIQHTWQEKTP